MSYNNDLQSFLDYLKQFHIKSRRQIYDTDEELKLQTHTLFLRGNNVNLLHIPQDCISEFHDRYSSLEHPPTLCEKLPSDEDIVKFNLKGTFKFYLDVDFDLSEFRKEDFNKVGNEAEIYFNKQIDILTSAVEEVVSEYSLECSSDSFNYFDAKRTCYKHHIIYPNVITNRKGATFLVKKILEKLQDDPFFKWKKVLDQKVYTNGLRMIGCTKDWVKDSKMNADSVAHQHIFKSLDGYSLQYKIDGLFTKDYVTMASIFTDNGVTITLPTRGGKINKNGVDSEDLEMDKMLSDFEPVDVNDPELVKEIDSVVNHLNEKYGWNLLNRIASLKTIQEAEDENGDIEVLCKSVLLEPQECPFINGKHKRTENSNGSTLYIVCMPGKCILKCFGSRCCQEGDVKSVVVEVGCESIELSEYIKDAFIYQTHESIGLLAFNLFKNSIACSRKFGTSRDWYIFSENKNRWLKRNIDKYIQVKDGPLQKRFTKYYTSLIDSGRLQGKQLKKLRDKYSKLVTKLQSEAGCHAIVQNLAKKMEERWISDKEVYFEDQLNNNTELMAFENGVYDYTKKEFRKGKPEDMLSISTKTNYIPWNRLTDDMRTTCLDYFKTLMPIENERDWLLYTLSRCLNPKRRRQKFYQWRGLGGDGKSKLFELIKESFGDYCRSSMSSMIMANAEKSSGPREDLMALRYARFFFFNETNKNDILNLMMVKKISDGGELPARALHQSQIEFQIPGTPFCVFNEQFNIKCGSNDEGSFRRLEWLEFKSGFFETQQELEKSTREFKFLAKSNEIMLQMFSELRITLPSLLIHYYELDKVYTEPTSFSKIREELRVANDIFSAFVSTVVKEDETETTFMTSTNLYKIFSVWLRSIGRKQIIEIDEFVKNIEKKLGNARRPPANSKSSERGFYVIELNPSESIPIQSKKSTVSPFVVEQLNQTVS